MVKSRKMKWSGLVAQIGEKRNMDRLLVRKPERKILLERLGCGWLGNIKMYLRFDGVVWTGFAWFRMGTIGGLV
jgi:hypothetical protein